MGLSRYRLGDFIELVINKNDELTYTEKDVRGVNNLKKLMPTKADLMSRDLTKFQIVAPGEFVFNHRTSRNGSKFSIAYNDTKQAVICTEDYVVFKVKEEAKAVLSSVWLYMLFNRSEFDRYVITNSWGSSTEFYNWSDICAIEIDLPPLAIQQKYVDVYNAMIANQQCYERGLDDLKLVCVSSIEKLKKEIPVESILPFIQERIEYNTDNKYDELIGVGNDGFIEPRGNREKSTFYKCNVFYPRDFVYNPSVVSKGAIAFNSKFTEPKICTEEYIVFFIKNDEKLLAEYLFLWLKRGETGRYLDFMNIDSVRNRVYFRDLESIRIPVPNIDIQKSIVGMFKAYNERKEINERLKEQIKSICPVLIKGSLEEARKKEV